MYIFSLIIPSPSQASDILSMFILTTVHKLATWVRNSLLQQGWNQMNDSPGVVIILLIVQ